MATSEQLKFAQRFPFTAMAKKIVKESNVSLGEVPEEIMNRAAVMISNAVSGKNYTLDIKSSELLEQEIVAFPVAKILISIARDPTLYRSFASMIARAAFLYLENSPDRKQLSLDLAKDLSLETDIIDSKGFFVSMPLKQYLGIKFNDPALKLVNQTVEKGRVFLNINIFCRFLSEVIFSKVLNDLPVETASMPQIYKSFARQLSQQLKQRQVLEFSFKLEGSINPNAFSPCMASLYQRLLGGEKLPHMARFFLATFLNAIGMSQQQMLAAFKKSPDYDEKIASYQLRRIAEQNYAAAACEKIRSYGFCPNADCRVKHPLTYYRRQLKFFSRGKQNK